MKTATASELDRMFDEGEDMTEYMDLSDVRRVPASPTPRRVALDMAETQVSRLDAYAKRYGITRQSLIKVWLTERMDEEDERAARRSAAAV